MNTCTKCHQRRIQNNVLCFFIFNIPWILHRTEEKIPRKQNEREMKKSKMKQEKQKNKVKTTKRHIIAS